MKNYIEIAIGALTLIGILWEAARQYHLIYKAIDKRNQAIYDLINSVEKRILAHEAECEVRHKYQEHILNRLEETIDAKLLHL